MNTEQHASPCADESDGDELTDDEVYLERH